ncbi:N-acetylglucosamine-6-phosphate deacetylase [Mesoplasma chauliocola]|uniref:N-acetylglucosamine-6-phosphate deacetylase n=1 Tax=Mesoplasma chauliocola TaxID=216427 RepID=A0A249SP96_9MOLU|nr:N-acetylglucosamine-6-phosphate deacetylase [Mesoplasma chauliocola]ASZ09442.1 N-acetylglucosamine-6-phosphate deacetylase [Mesoplasma chauliocola]
MILKNAKIVLQDKIIENGSLLIKDNKIIKISEKEIDANKEEVIDLKGNYLMPGFIDCHVHGGYGVDFETGDEKRFLTFSENVIKEGITSYVQASVTNSVEDNKKYLTEFKNFKNAKNIKGAKCLGVHMEGPFISAEKKGAHDPNLLVKPNIDLIKEFIEISNKNIKIVTYASELQDGSFTKYLINNKIVPSVGHTNQESYELEKDYLLGAKHVTHIFNGMSGVDHYRPGLAVSALTHKDILVEVISDGVHLNEDILDLIYKIKGADNICIITDSINAKGLSDGEYKIGNLEVIKKGIEVRLKSNNVLAGSGATYNHNVKFYKEKCLIPMTELIKMTSINIAKQLNIYEKTGSIEENKIADLVVVDKEFNVLYTFVEGKKVYER